MKQIKFSRQRESILENLKGRTDHPTADMIYSDIRLIHPKVSLGTVYRNLSLLAEDNKILKLVSDDGVTHFDYNTTPHNHFICRKCGAMSDLKLVDTEELCTAASKGCSGKIERCDVMFYGLCEKCYVTQ